MTDSWAGGILGKIDIATGFNAGAGHRFFARLEVILYLVFVHPT